MHRYDEDLSSREVLADLLVRYVGHGNLITAEALAQDCGCSKEAVYLARKGQVIGLDLGMKMLSHLPDEAVAEFFAHLGFTGFYRIDGLESDHHEAGHAMASGVALYTKTMLDQRIDHQEHRLLVRGYFKVIACLSRLTARRRGEARA